jgi:hypothetical protein
MPRGVYVRKPMSVDQRRKTAASVWAHHHGICIITIEELDAVEGA